MNLIFKTLTPMAHGEFSDGIDTGNFSNFRRMPIYNNGNIISTPVLSGNAIRGVMRRNLVAEMIKKFDLKKELGNGFDRFYIAAANGGNLEKNLAVSVDVEGIRKIREEFPFISAFGSALYTYMLPGMASIGFAIPRVKELDTGSISVSEITHDIGFTRHIDKTVSDSGDAKPMPYTIETVIQGIEFDFPLDFESQATDIEKSCVMHGIKTLKTLGGHIEIGLGKIEIEKADELDDEEYQKWLNSDDSLQAIVHFSESIK